MSKGVALDYYQAGAANDDFRSVEEIAGALGVKYNRLGLNVGSLPFAPADTTAGSESEMQTVVIGNKSNADLPLFIEESNYYDNTRRRARAGDMPRSVITDLERYINGNRENVWENSWVRFPEDKLGEYARLTMRHDLLADKSNCLSGQRSDVTKFYFQKDGCQYIRVPISYLLKLSLSEIIDPRHKINPVIHQTGRAIMSCYLNDNTSPETSSFYVVSMNAEAGMGRQAAKEMAIRFLFTQILTIYANQKFGLVQSGQQAVVFLSPHPPIRQKELSNCVSDAFYRELFMNPCLSGWDRGEEKYQYMHLCHRVLSRSQFNAVLKLREAGIINSNLVSLPNLSNISLANNGIHVSLGSRKLSGLLNNSSSGFSARDEKYLGDLVVKTVEHFLPLFVGTYSAAPYRLDFIDFHPEKALGFLPHELDFTHLRMLWRRWRKKADLKILGRSVTPFGPLWLDHLISRIFRLKGDFVPDFRLIDYLVVLMSTDKSSALDGVLDNSRRLKDDLADLGVFDTKMSLYLLEKLREFNVMGFSGFEGRHYSLFQSFMQDMGPAVTLQNLLYLLAFKYIVTGQITHAHIPDNPYIESERRQIFFGSAIGLPTFFVKANTGNELLKRIIRKTDRVRPSRRYPGYVRVHHLEYRRALLKILREDAADLIEMINVGESLNDLESRLSNPSYYSTCGKLTRGILDIANVKSPMDLSAEAFNQAAEKYYRTDLRLGHIQEAMEALKEDLITMEKNADGCNPDGAKLIGEILQGQKIGEFLDGAKRDVSAESISEETLEKLARMILAQIHYKTQFNSNFLEAQV